MEPLNDTSIESSEEESLAVASPPMPATADGKIPEEGLFSDHGFDFFELSPETLEGVAARGYLKATPVQAHCIPKAIEGRDLIVRSKTGTGKTAAFGIPIVEKIGAGSRRPQALVLAPTRELALQGAQEIESLGKSKGVRVCAVYGGASMQKQIDALDEGVEVVVGTPGRIIDQMRRGHLDLSEVGCKVLDEADEMLSMGFFEDVCRILRACPGDSQTLLFSATVSPDIEDLIKNFTSDPETVLLSGDEYSVEGIENILYETRDDYPKPRNLLYLVEKEKPAAAIVFCNTRDDTSLVAAVLTRHGWQAEILNSDLSQKERERVMRRVKSGDLRFMVATDLAARGIDITGLTHVINYSLPDDPLVYMHRVGRTGRIGRGGIAISLMGGKDLSTLSVLEKRFGVVFERRTLPDPEEARQQWTDRHIKELKTGMEGSVFEAFLPLVKDVKARNDGDFILAYALKAYFESRRPKVQQERAEDAKREERRESREGGGRRGGREGRRDGRSDRDGGREKTTREERPAKDRGGARGGSSKGEVEDNGARLFVNLGTEAGLDAEGIKILICEAAGADPQSVVSVEPKDTFSFVVCRDEDAARALMAADKTPHGEDGQLKVEVAKASRGGRRRRRK